MFSCCCPVQPFLSHFCLRLPDRIPVYLDGLTPSVQPEKVTLLLVFPLLVEVGLFPGRVVLYILLQ